MKEKERLDEIAEDLKKAIKAKDLEGIEDRITPLILGLGDKVDKVSAYNEIVDLLKKQGKRNSDDIAKIFEMLYMNKLWDLWSKRLGIIAGLLTAFYTFLMVKSSLGF